MIKQSGQLLVRIFEEYERPTVNKQCMGFSYVFHMDDYI